MKPTEQHRAFVAGHRERVTLAYHGELARGIEPSRIVVFLAPADLDGLADVLLDLGAPGAPTTDGAVVVAVDREAARDRFGLGDGAFGLPAPRLLVQLGWTGDDIACWKDAELGRRGAC